MELIIHMQTQLDGTSILSVASLVVINFIFLLWQVRMLVMWCHFRSQLFCVSMGLMAVGLQCSMCLVRNFV